MKIALIKGTRGLEGAGGGPNYLVARLANQFKKQQHDVKLIYGNHLPLPETLSNLHFGEISGYDIVHAVVPELLAFVSSRSPIVTTFCDDIMCKPSIYLRGTEKKIDRFLLRANKETVKFLIKKGLKKCNKVVAISEEAKRGAIESFNVPENKIVCIPPGVDTDTFKPLSIQRKDKSKLKLFFCGGIGRRKGVDILLEALQILKRKMPIELWLAGSIHSLFPLNQIIKELDLTKEVRHFGFVSDKKLNRLYNEVDIFVFPSFGEGYGIPPLEALYCGTKVVCSRIPSIKEFSEFVTLTDTNPQSVAENILKAIDKEVNFRLARRKIEKDYSLQAVGTSYLNLYKEMLGEK